MDSRARFLGHPIHQQLVAFPVGLLAAGVVFDLVHLVGDSPTMAVVAHWMIVAGLVGGVLAAPFGAVDWWAIPRGTRAKAVGAMHGGGNVVMLLLFLASWWLRRDLPAQPPVAAHVLSFAGAGLALVTAWLGGELVSRLGVGVSDAASLDAPSSLRQTAPARAARASRHGA